MSYKDFAMTILKCVVENFEREIVVKFKYICGNVLHV